MSSDNTQTPAQPATTTPTWEEQANVLVPAMSAFLGSRRQSFTCNHDLTVGQGAPVTTDQQTYTREQVTAFVVDVLELCADRTDCKLMPTPSTLGKGALAKFLSGKSTHANVSKFIVVKALNSFRRSLKSANKAEKLRVATDAGTHWFADGVVDSQGNPRTFVSRRKAVSAWVRNNHPLKGEWHTDKGSWKSDALAHVRQGAVDATTAQATRDAAATPAPVAAQSSVSAKVSKADLVKQAVALGLPVAAAKSMTKAKLSATIGALSNL